jgi:hypothetical protein
MSPEIGDDGEMATTTVNITRISYKPCMLAPKPEAMEMGMGMKGEIRRVNGTY